MALFCRKLNKFEKKKTINHLESLSLVQSAQKGTICSTQIYLLQLSQVQLVLRSFLAEHTWHLLRTLAFFAGGSSEDSPKKFPIFCRNSRGSTDTFWRSFRCSMTRLRPGCFINRLRFSFGQLLFILFIIRPFMAAMFNEA